jgi:hypothetical protein
MNITDIVIAVLALIGLGLAVSRGFNAAGVLHEKDTRTRTFASESPPMGEVVKIASVMTDPVREVTQSIIAVILIIGCMLMLALFPVVNQALPAGLIGVVTGYYFKS